MIEVSNLTSVRINPVKFKKVVKTVLNKEKISLKSDISIAIVNPQKIRLLNKKYRRKDKPTDVLSFIYGKKKNVLSGEIIICPQVVKKNAKDVGENFQKELVKVLIHGALHILGYDHENNKRKEKIMSKKEEFYPKEVKF